MAINKLCKSYVTFLLIVAILIFSPGASGHRMSESLGGDTDEELEKRIATFLKQDPNQQRASLTYNAILARVARERARDMGQRNYFGHVNPDGIGANYLVTQAGYVLPDFYGSNKSSNNIESIAAGSETAEEAWSRWMNSTAHRTHLLGLTKFYAEQVEYGVGHAFAPDSRYKHYWVVITAKPGKGGESLAPTGRGDSEAEASTAYPHVVRGANGKLRPASGYVWVTDDPNDFRVKLMPGLIRTGGGNYRPAKGYTWVNPADPDDLRVRPIQ